MIFSAKQADDGFVNNGIVAHITGAAPGGPRYDPSLTPEARKHQSNGILLCNGCATLVDSDEKYYTVEMLREWKRLAETSTFDSTLRAPTNQQIELLLSKTEFHALMLAAAKADLATFKKIQWPIDPIELNLRRIEKDNSHSFNVSDLVTILETFNEITIVAPPGTGKTTTLLQTVHAILCHGNSVAVFIPLSEWSSQSERFFESILHRHAFREINEKSLRSFVKDEQLVLIMDGWNELDMASKKRASSEIKSLQRDFPNLSVVMSTRRETLNVPIAGHVIEIDTLTENQQLEIAYALRGTEGEDILNHAWLTVGIRELVKIPLYLTALLTYIKPGSVFPTTKEEVLRLFISKHETLDDKKETFLHILSGFQKKFLTALAVEATRTGNITITDDSARSIVKKIEDQLSETGQIQISSAPQPNVILNTLVSHHLLLRSNVGKNTGYSFQHQQFQEWYASFKVEDLMLASVAGDLDAKQKLKIEVLNQRTWEEPVLFACERMSRANQAELQAVAAILLEVLGIDPMLAAEIIYRSSDNLWEKVRDKVINFVEMWYRNGTVDRAVHFMINTGRGDFAPKIWPLISNEDSQMHLAMLRTGRYFRPSVLGIDVEARIAQLPDRLRENIISEIAYRSGMDGIELATKLARIDRSPKVQTSVIEALQFRRADRFITMILYTAQDEVWPLLARKGYLEGITDPKFLAHLHYEQQYYIESETDLLNKLHMLLDIKPIEASFGHEIGTLIKAADFPVKNQNAGWIINEAYKRYPDVVTSALFDRLKSGYEIPFHTEDLLHKTNITIDEGSLVNLITEPNSNEKISRIAVSIVGPKTVGKLIDMLISVNTKLITTKKTVDEATRKEYHRLSSLILKTNLTSFLQSILSRGLTVAIDEISLLLDLIAHHGNRVEQSTLPIHGESFENMILTIKKWAEILLASPR